MIATQYLNDTLTRESPDSGTLFVDFFKGHNYTLFEDNFLIRKLFFKNSVDIDFEKFPIFPYLEFLCIRFRDQSTYLDFNVLQTKCPSLKQIIIIENDTVDVNQINFSPFSNQVKIVKRD